MMRKTDEQVREEVLEELEWDSRLPSSEIGVHVKGGIVTLVGTATSYAAKLAAEEGAHRVPGVLDVANEIQVRTSGKTARSDGEIAQAVRRALEWDALVDDETIHSTVSDGWVTLRGTVDRLRERDDAERAVRHLNGVRGVTNSIEVLGPPPNAEKLREKLVGALERHARREATHIEVRVEEHAVTLSGKVDSWLEKRAVLGIVSHTPGVRQVNDAIEVDPYHS
jgi:osmotically-inducible protein OsmY